MYEMSVIRFNEGKSKEGFELMQQIPQKYPSEILPKVYLRLAMRLSGWNSLKPLWKRLNWLFRILTSKLPMLNTGPIF